MKKKEIIYSINGRFLERKEKFGVHRYAHEICKCLNENDSVNKKICICISSKVSNEEVECFNKIKIVKFGHFNGTLWEQIDFPIFLIKNKLTAINLIPTAPYLCPGIVSIHDIYMLIHPENFNRLFALWYKLLFFKYIKRAKLILTVSEFSKQEINTFFTDIKQDIVVIPNAWQHMKPLERDEGVFTKYSIDQKYYFTLANTAKHKNFIWIYNEACQNPNKLFVVSGAINQIVTGVNENNLQSSNIKYVGYVTDKELKALLENCEGFLFPSLYEGFGIPPLEALSVGCKVIVSDIPVFREIYQDSVYYINPYDYNVNIDELIKNEIDDSDKVLKKYSWKDSADKLVELL